MGRTFGNQGLVLSEDVETRAMLYRRLFEFQVPAVFEASVGHPPSLPSDQSRAADEGLHLHDVTVGAHPDVPLGLLASPDGR